MTSYLIGHDVLQDYLFNFLHGRFVYFMDLITIDFAGIHIHSHPK